MKRPTKACARCAEIDAKLSQVEGALKSTQAVAEVLARRVSARTGGTAAEHISKAWESVKSERALSETPSEPNQGGGT